MGKCTCTRQQKLSAFVDCCTIVPFVGWGLMSCFAIPSYSSGGWFAPVVLAVVSTILCGCAVREMWMRSHRMRQQVYLALEVNAPPPAKDSRFRGGVALSFALVCIAWMMLCLLVENTVIRPAEEASMPCGCNEVPGRQVSECCHACVDDLYCHAWSSEVLSASPITSICPPGIRDVENVNADLQATFSCLADDAWMYVP